MSNHTNKTHQFCRKMKKIKLLIIISVILTIYDNTYAIGEPAVIMSMGNVKSLQNTSQTVFYNPSNTQQAKTIEGSISLSNGYFMKELSTTHAAISWGSKLGSFNSGFERFGNQLYNSNRLLLGYANKWNNFSAGVNFNYLIIHIIGSKPGQMIYSQIGSKMVINKNFTAAFTLTNIEQSVIIMEESKITIPTEIICGLKWHDKKLLSLYVEAEQCIKGQLRTKCGAEISPNNLFTFRLGCFNSPITPTAGFGLKLRDLTVDLGFLYDTTLGVSSSISLSYKL